MTSAVRNGDENSQLFNWRFWALGNQLSRETGLIDSVMRALKEQSCLATAVSPVDIAKLLFMLESDLVEQDAMAHREGLSNKLHSTQAMLVNRLWEPGRV